MQKATITEVGVLVVFGAIAAGLAIQLSDRHVSVSAIVAVVAFTLVAGASLANAIAQSMRTTLYTCPTKGCTVSIRARGTSSEELARLRDLATDHAKHGAAR